MLGVLLYGFHRVWRSSRELQKTCEENDAMRYLVGGTACIDQEIRKLFRIFEKKYQKTFGNKKYDIDYNVVNYSSVLRHRL